MKHLFWVACFSRQRERLKVPNTSHIGYIIGGSQTENKYFYISTPPSSFQFYQDVGLSTVTSKRMIFCFHHYFSQSMANRIHGCPPYHHIPLFYCNLGL